MSDSSKIRSTTNVKLLTDAKNSFSDAFKLFSTEVRNNGLPLPDSSGAQAQRPGDIRGSLKVINNILFEHDRSFTTVKRTMQPKCQRPELTSVDMDKLTTIAERLEDAMRSAGVHASELARACGVSPAAVHKWLNGGKLSADNLAAAARGLGVREDWLRTGKLPRERENGTQEHDVDRVIDILEELQGPLAALAVAIEQLSRSRSGQAHKRRKA